MQYSSYRFALLASLVQAYAALPICSHFVNLLEGMPVQAHPTIVCENPMYRNMFQGATVFADGGAFEQHGHVVEDRVFTMFCMVLGGLILAAWAILLVGGCIKGYQMVADYMTGSRTTAASRSRSSEPEPVLVRNVVGAHPDVEVKDTEQLPRYSLTPEVPVYTSKAA